MLTNDELKSKIVKVLQELRASKPIVPNDYGLQIISCMTDREIADALIAAGYGDVKAAVKDFAEKITVLIKGTMGIGHTDFWKGYGKAKYDAIEIIKQAEKELAEGRKDG